MPVERRAWHLEHIDCLIVVPALREQPCFSTYHWKIDVGKYGKLLLPVCV